MSPERERESKMCLTGRQHKLRFFWGKKEKCLGLDLFHLSDRRPLMSLCFFYSNNEGWIFWPSPIPVSICVFWFVCMRVCYSLHSTPHNNTVYLQGASRTGLCSNRASHGRVEGALWLLLLLTTSVSCTPRAKTCKNKAFSRDSSAFPWSRRSTPGVPVPEQRVQPVLLRLFGKLNVSSMHLGEG